VTIFLLKRQIESLEKAFLEEGGIRERMTAARLQVREQQRKDERDQRDRKV
jgi:four helix bundle suffix protein